MSSSRTISANGIDMFVREAGQGPLVVLCHGWPELSYSWRHQIAALAAAGFRVAAPDMRGFGRTTAPADVGAYTIFDTVGDMVALVAALGERKAMIVGHDWGAPVAWHAALFRPDIFTKVAGLSVPPPFRGRGRPLETLREGGITNFYWQYFQPPGVAEAEFERDIAHTMRLVLGRGVSDPSSMFVDEAKGFLGKLPAGMPLPAWPDRGRHRRIRRGLPAVRLPRRPELVPQSRPQLGADRALAGCADPSAVAVHRRLERFGDYRADRCQAGRRHGTRAAEPAAEADHRGRRPLDPAGAPGRGQRGADRISEMIRPKA
ncbi:pimeloyl-ACP methyl ester carboxylesterase [Bradyrhizobium sp. JR6.1]